MGADDSLQDGEGCTGEEGLFGECFPRGVGLGRPVLGLDDPTCAGGVGGRGLFLLSLGERLLGFTASVSTGGFFLVGGTGRGFFFVAVAGVDFSDILNCFTFWSVDEGGSVCVSSLSRASEVPDTTVYSFPFLRGFFACGWED